MISDRELNDVFRIIRHDWLNQLQLIKANMSLNRLDRIDGIIKRIVEEAQNESNLSNLKATQLTSFLLRHKTLNKDYPLHIKVPQMSLDLSHLDEQITANLETLFHKIKALTPSTALLLEIKKTEEHVQFLLQITIEGLTSSQFENAFESLPFHSDFTADNKDDETVFLTLNWPLP